jgi:hypothetical protein
VSYQRPAEQLEESIVDDMHKPERFKIYLGQEDYYHDFLVFFQQEIDDKGWQNTLQEHLFAKTEHADDMLVRLYAGFLHPLIHLGFGIEFQQPAIIAEALAQAAVHDNWMAPLFLGCEKAAEAKRGDNGEKKSIAQILEECKNDEKIRSSAQFGDGNKIRDGILKRAPEEMIKAATQYTVKEDELEERNAEMVNAAGMSLHLPSASFYSRASVLTSPTVYFAASAQRPPHQIKFDFFYMHCVNSSIFFSAFLSPTSGLSRSTQRRLLEWKIWNDIVMYVSRGCPDLLIDEIHNYTPTKDSDMGSIIKRANKVEDDGHACKLVRAIANAEAVCKGYEEKEGFRIEGNMWRKLGHMAVDSVEAGEPHWVRSCGFKEAWEKIPLRDGARL